jgi:hypothetical protein
MHPSTYTTLLPDLNGRRGLNESKESGEGSDGSAHVGCLRAVGSCCRTIDLEEPSLYTGASQRGAPVLVP